MYKNFVTLTTAILFLTVSPRLLSAQTYSSKEAVCLQQASLKLRPNSLISIVRVDGSRISGRLASIDFDQALLTMHPLNKAGKAPTTFQIAKIAKIQYRRAGKLKPGWMALGLIGGAFFGTFIGDGVDDSSDSFSWGGPIGLVVGAGGGLLIGTFVPMALPSTRTIKCK